MQYDTTPERMFPQKCRKNGLKVTPQRMAIYRALSETRSHPSAETVYRTVKIAFPHISFDTVHRTLLTFVRIGLVEVVEVFGGAKRFDTDISPHHHLHCTRCGKIQDFTSRVYDRLDIPEDIADRFLVTGKRVVLKGLCSYCRRENPGTGDPPGHNTSNTP